MSSNKGESSKILSPKISNENIKKFDLMFENSSLSDISNEDIKELDLNSSKKNKII